MRSICFAWGHFVNKRCQAQAGLVSYPTVKKVDIISTFGNDDLEGAMDD